MSGINVTKEVRRRSAREFRAESRFLRVETRHRFLQRRSAFLLNVAWLGTIVAYFCCASVVVGAEFTPIFDGKTLEGWEGNTETFRVQDGAIIAGSLQHRIERNEFLCTTREYGDFELRAKVLLKGEGDNAGIQIRSARVPGNTEVRGYQCDIGREGKKLIWGFLYDEARRRKFLAECPQERLNKVVDLHDWNELRIRCEGNRVRISLNGVETVDYREQDPTIPQRGIIGLQIHAGKPSEAWYKEIEIRELPDK